jgi:hypothetical protein
MTSQSLHHVGAIGTYNPHLMTPESLSEQIRKAGGVVNSLGKVGGGVRPVVQIFLVPGAFPMDSDRPYDSSVLVSTRVLADPRDGSPAPLPAAFCESSLRNAINFAESVSIVSRPGPGLDRLDDLPQERLAPTVRRVTTIEAPPETAAEWLSLVTRRKQDSAVVRLFGLPEAAREAVLASARNALIRLD